jgi:hypothetical protein
MRVGHCAVIEFNSESDAKEEIENLLVRGQPSFQKLSL